MHHLFLILFFVLQKTSSVEFDPNVTTTSLSAKLNVKSNGDCCCQYSLKYYLNLTDANSSCGKNQNCSNCETFVLEKLYPKTKYILTYTLPNSSFITALLETKPLVVSLTVTPTSSTVKVDVAYNVHFNITGCVYNLYSNGKHFSSCSNDCGTCSGYLFHGLTPMTEYIVEYWNPFQAINENRTFSTKSSNFNVQVNAGYTNASFEISSSILYYSNCNAKLSIYPDREIDFDCKSTPGCNTCGHFTITGLKPNVAYILTFTFDNGREIREIYFLTSFMILRQEYSWQRVDLIHMYVSVLHFIPNNFYCTVEIVPNHAKCKEPCPTDCSSYYIELSKYETFNVSLSSPDALESSSGSIVPKPYQFKISSHYIDGHTIKVTFTPNVKGGGKCTLKVFVLEKEVQYNCTNGKCPTDCDHLTYSLGNIDINSIVTFQINNTNMKEPNRLDLNLVSDITIDEYIHTTVSTVNVTVYHGGTCCCNASVSYGNSKEVIYDNCQNNIACKNCSSFAFTNLIANSYYLLQFTLPDGTILKRNFRTKQETIKVTFHSSSSEIDVKITSDVVMKPADCTLELLDENNIIKYSCGKYINCKSCYENNFYALSPDTTYKFIFKSIYMQKSYETKITTKPSNINASISTDSSYNYINISVKIYSTTDEECDVKVVNISTLEKIPFSCFYIEGCKKCNNFTVKNLQAYIEYAIVIKFVNSDTEISKRVRTKYISFYQYYDQISVSEINVSTHLYGYYFDSYHCNIKINGSSASCIICPTNCTSYTLQIISFDPFSVTLESDMSYKSDTIRVIPKPLIFIYDYSTYDGLILQCKFTSNFKGAGMCTIEGYDGIRKIDIQCDNSPCVQNCENLTLSISGINHDANFSLKISNSYLLKPQIFKIKLERNIDIDNQIITTSTSAFITVTGGNTCCCKAIITSTYGYSFYQNVCEQDKDCQYCKSFHVNDLIPDTFYKLEYHTPNGEVIYKYFWTDFLHVKQLHYISFTSIEITIQNELGHEILASKCSTSIKVGYEYITSCYRSCKNCTYIVINNLQPNTTYTIYYFNYYSLSSSYTDITTLDSKGEFPNLTDAAQFDYRSIYIMIDNVTPEDYVGSYDIYAVEDESIEFHIANQAPVLKGLFDKRFDSFFVELDLHFEVYMIVMCFDIVHDKCKQKPDNYFCLICYQKKLKVCSEKLLHFSTGNFSLSNDNNELNVSHTLKALTCHEKLKCYVTFIYVMRKYVSLHALDHYPDRKNYYNKGMGVNYIMFMNDTECREKTITISSKNTYSKLPLVSYTGVFYTVSFVTCNSIACFPSMLYDKFFVSASQTGNIIVFVIILIISIGLFVTSVIILHKYIPVFNSSQDAYNETKPSISVLTTQDYTTDGAQTSDTAALNFAISA